jgi:hypothetical protein
MTEQVRNQSKMKLLSIPFCVIFLLGMIGCADPDPAQMSEADLRATAEAIHDAVITIDSHDDIPFDFATESVRCNDEVRCDPPYDGRDVSGSH